MQDIGPSARPSVIDTYPIIRGIPQSAVSSHKDIFDTIVDKTLTVEIFMSDKRISIARRASEIDTSCITGYP